MLIMVLIMVVIMDGMSKFNVVFGVFGFGTGFWQRGANIAVDTFVGRTINTLDSEFILGTLRFVGWRLFFTGDDMYYW